VIDLGTRAPTMTKRMTKRTTRPSKQSTRTRISAPSALAMHSAASPEWGTPMLLRRFGQVVLRPAAMSAGSIDLDYATSAYWQSWWPGGDHPTAFLNGDPGRDVLVEADRRAAFPRLGAGFLNAPGLNGGDMVQQCWGLFEEDHRKEKLGSGCWVGFSVEQFGSLQNIGERNPLMTGPDDLITTIVPSRRAHYVVHPEQLIAITQKKQKKREKKSKPWIAEQKLIARLRARTDEAPVDAGAPSHLSYITLLWHRERAVRRVQMEAARDFLKEQQADKKSLLHKFEVIGPLELEAR
jgi:Holliday junction resolvase-like predicted endonuclease